MKRKKIDRLETKYLYYKPHGVTGFAQSAKDQTGYAPSEKSLNLKNLQLNPTQTVYWR